MIYSLQVLRALAALLVVFHHANVHYDVFNRNFLWGFFGAGYSGVDIFFVLSGFIIYRLSWISTGSSEKIGNFLKKRLIRIYPAYWIFMFIPLLLVAVILPSLSNIGNQLDFLSFMNTFFLGPNHARLSQVSWTLSHEMMYYILFATLFVSRKIVYFMGFLGFVCLANFLNLLFVKKYIFESGTILSFVSDPINLEFGLGMLVAWMMENKKPFRPVLILGTGIFLFVSSMTFSMLGTMDLIPWRLFFFGIPSFLLVYGTVNLELAGKLAIKKNSWLVLVGGASYVLYLIHSPLLSVFHKKLVLPHHNGLELFWTFLGIVGIIFLGKMLHLFVELPVVNFLRRRFIANN